MAIIKLGGNLTFYCNTFTPSTGAAVDADAVPSYRVYEVTTDTPLLTGNMALLDDANTVGFYAATIAVTTANGFEAAKSYVVRMAGVVASVTGVTLLPFEVTAVDVDDLVRCHIVYIPTVAAITPTFGASIIEGSTLNGNMETGDPPTGWLAYASSLDGIADERTGGGGAQSLAITSTGNDSGFGYQAITAVIGTWYYLSAWTKNIDAVSAQVYLLRTDYSNPIAAINDASTSWVDAAATGRATVSTMQVIGVANTTTSAKTVRIDDIILKPINLASTLGTAYDVGNDGWFEIAATLTAGTQAGMWICLDNATVPANGYLAYHDGTNVHLVQVKAGVYTELINTAATYVAGARLSVWKSGTKLLLYYNDVLIDTQQTGDATLTGIKLAAFSTYSSNSFTNLACSLSTVATPGADGDTLKTLSDQLDGAAASAATAAAYAIVNSGLGFRGTVTAADPGVSFTIGTLAGLGAGAFADANTPWYAYVLRDAGGVAGAPQGEYKLVTGYTTATGLFTTSAFTVAVAAGDDVIIQNGRITDIAAIKIKTDYLPSATAGASGGLPVLNSSLEVPKVKAVTDTVNASVESILDTPLQSVSIWCLAVFGDYIYAGTGFGDIFRSIDGTTWTEVYQSPTETRIYSLAVLGSYIYAATGLNGKILRSSDGTTWTEVYDSTTESYIRCLAVLGTYIYAATGTGGGATNGKILRSSDGTTWTEVYDSATETDIFCLAVLGSYIYAGTYNGGKILRSSDGTTWTEVYDSATETYIYCLAAFDGYIYAGTGENGTILRSSDGTTWTEVYDSATETYIFCLGVLGSYIYAGTHPNGKIIRSSDGTSWTEVYDSLTEIQIRSLVAFGTNMYAGTGLRGKILCSSDGTTWTKVYEYTNMGAAFKKFFNVATPTGTVNSLPDAVPGASAGLPVLNSSLEVPKVKAVTDTVNASLVSILGTALSETGGLIAAAFSKFFNKATPTGTVNSIPDAVAGATGGLAIVGSAMSLNQAAATIAAAVAGADITAQRGDTLVAALTGIGNISTRTKLWFTVKTDRDDADTAALVQIEETLGLIYLNGAAATAGNGSLTIVNATTGAVTITLAAAATAALSEVAGLYYDIQMLTATTVQTMCSGTFNVSADVTRAVS